MSLLDAERTTAAGCDGNRQILLILAGAGWKNQSTDTSYGISD